MANPHKKTSLGESLAGSHAYNPIRHFRRNSWRDFSCRKVSPRVSDRIICMTPDETLSEIRYLYAGSRSYYNKQLQSRAYTSTFWFRLQLLSRNVAEVCAVSCVRIPLREIMCMFAIWNIGIYIYINQIKHIYMNIRNIKETFQLFSRSFK